MENASAASLPGNRRRCRSACLAVSVASGSTTITRPGASGSQCSCWCGARGGRVGSPDEDRGGVGRGAGVESLERGPVDVTESDVSRLVANRVRVDLGRAEPVEETQREVIPDHPEGAGVVGIQDRLAAAPRRPRGAADLRSPPARPPTRPLRRHPRPCHPPSGAEPATVPSGRGGRRCRRSSTCGRAFRG